MPDDPSPSALPYDPSRTALYAPELSKPTPDFNIGWSVDWICAELSRLAYYRFERGDGPRLDAALTQAGFAEAATFNVPAAGAQGFATRMPGGPAFVAFRGTQPGDLRDLAADARTNRIAFGGAATVHAGFLAAYRAVEDPLSRWLGATSDQSLVFTGHSLGAAMATVAAAARPQASLVTFGSPRVGDAAFAALFAGRAVRRYVDCADLVTAVPPPLLGYAHVGQQLYIDRFGAVHQESLPPAAMADDRRRARLSYLVDHGWKLWRNVVVRDLADHAPANYISAVLGRR